MLEVDTFAVYTELGSIINEYYYHARPCHIAFLNCPQSFCDCVISINIVFASNYSSRGVLLHIVKDKQSVEEVKKKKENKKKFAAFYLFQLWHIQVVLSCMSCPFLSTSNTIGFPHKLIVMNIHRHISICICFCIISQQISAQR